jgi:putative toxin-antitoxin system antitoxin component (TIGR02293 family)
MTEAGVALAREHAETLALAELPFAVRRGLIDAALIAVFENSRLRKVLKEEQKLNLPIFGARVFRAVEAAVHLNSSVRSSDSPSLTVHKRLVEGLPGQALFISASLGCETLNEALPFFDLTAKTAWHKLDSELSRAQGEQALRLARVAVMAAALAGSPEAGRAYLRTPNFALGGATPLELLKTADGEQLVLTELQTQADGGPV